MPTFEPTRSASLVESIHQPMRSTVAACLNRWVGLDGGAKAHCYLVVEGDEMGARVTLNSQQIAQLAQVRGLAA
ncbi:hypothetical protein ACT009_11640 [Sphingomonas sp. Tas61C01]|uniref:hypothetical protein n=1 Tax=Sphingomonas sp. Tas61C01 TaxID=3458297 RepID=UPI00403EB0C1